MTGTLIIKQTSSGKKLYYAHLEFKDPCTLKWHTKDVATGLEIKGNKRKAESMLEKLVVEFAFLEAVKVEEDLDIELCDFLDQWLEEKRCRIRGNTYDTYASRIVTIKRFFGEQHIKLRDVTPKDLMDCFRFLLESGKVSQKDGRLQPLSVRSVRSCRSILDAAFDAAVIKGIVLINPVKNTKVSNASNKNFSEEFLFLTEDEIRELLLFLDGHDKYRFLKPIVFMGVYYGLRREEILGLRWDAIKKQSIIIRHTVTGSKTIYVEDKTKTNYGYRELNLFPTASACLEQIRQQQKQNREFFGNAYYAGTEGYVFTHEDGTPYRPDFLTRKMGKAMSEFGRPEITLHKLRHTCASLLIDKGWDIKKVQYWLGDADASTVMNIYAHYMRHKENLAENDLAEMSENVSDLF